MSSSLKTPQKGAAADRPDIVFDNPLNSSTGGGADPVHEEGGEAVVTAGAAAAVPAKLRVDESLSACIPYRDRCLRKVGNLRPEEVVTLTNVTFLTDDEIMNIERVFELLAETMASFGTLETVKRRSSATGEVTEERNVAALTTKQLSDHLPEFGGNVFFDRLVRLFSESGQQKLTLLELIDLYSAMSPRANFNWKTKMAFCILDYDEDGVLGERDLVKAINHMIRGTKKTHTKILKPSQAASHIQAV
eukprot:COSAG05_NODE_402_length_10229_cov_3.609674_2_plen_248_part_00